MRNIIWKNLIQNIIRCIIAYPLFLIAFVISIPSTLWIYEKTNDFDDSLYPIKGS